MIPVHRATRKSAVILVSLFFLSVGISAQVPVTYDASFASLSTEFVSRVNFTQIPAVAESKAGVPGVQFTWRNFFTLVEARNTKLRVEGIAIEAANADLDGAKARYFPAIKFETSGSLVGNPIDPITIAAGGFGEMYGILLPQQDVLLNKGQESTYYNFKVILDQPVLTWGKLPLGVSLAETGIGLSRTKREKLKYELEVETKTLFETLSCIVPLESALALQDDIGARLLALTEKSQANGLVTKADLFATKVKLKQIGLARMEAKNRRDGLLARLASLADIASFDIGQLSFPSGAAGLPPIGEADAPSRIEGSFSIRLLEGLIEVKEGLAKMADLKAGMLPDIGFKVELSYAGSRFPFIETDWLRQDDWQLYVSFGTQGSLFDKVKAGDAAKALVERESARDELKEARRAIAYFLKETYLGLELTRAKLEYTVLKLEGSRDTIADKRLLLNAGAGSEADLLEVLVDALGTLAEGYGLLAEYRSGINKIEGILGGS